MNPFDAEPVLTEDGRTVLVARELWEQGREYVGGLRRDVNDLSVLKKEAELERDDTRRRIERLEQALREHAVSEMTKLLREFLERAPRCEPNTENHYGWPAGWEEESVDFEHHPSRSRCFNCNEWCSESSPCYGCDARVTYERLVVLDRGKT